MGIILPNYVYYLFEHLSFCVLVYLVWLLEVNYRREVFTFLLLSIGDLVDYILRYSESFRLIGFKVTYDIVQMVIFAGVIVKTMLANGRS